MGIMECIFVIAKILFLISIFSVLSILIDDYETSHLTDEISEDETTDTNSNKWHW